MKRIIAPLLASAIAFAALVAAPACKKKVNDAQCGELLDRYASLVVRERHPDATPEAIAAEQARERDAAQHDDDFKNCTTELSTEDYACAMKATTSEALVKCLE
jgi:hypothetical protein